MDEKVRTFIAIDLPAEVKVMVRGAIQELKSVGAKVVWTRLENLHLTLKFLGNTSTEQLDKVKACLAEVALENSPFEVSFSGLGGFPNEKKPRVLWIGVSAGEAELKKLFYQMERELVPLGFKEEKNEFVPHLTVGRIKIPKTNKALEDKILKEKERSLGRFNVNDFSFIQSTLTSDGPVYHVLEKFSL